MHKLTKDVVIDGHFLPKGTSIVPQISAVLADGEVYGNKFILNQILLIRYSIIQKNSVPNVSLTKMAN